MDPLRLRMARVIARVVRWAVVEAPGNDTDPYPTQRMGFLGKIGTSQTWFPYGFSAHAPAGALALMFAVGGDSDAHVHLPGSPQSRPELKQGEVVMYHPASGAKVHFQEDGSIEVTSAIDVTINGGAAVNVNAINIGLTGDVTITGNAVVSGTMDVNDTLNANADLNDQNGIEMSAHIHNVPGWGDSIGPKDP